MSHRALFLFIVLPSVLVVSSTTAGDPSCADTSPLLCTSHRGGTRRCPTAALPCAPSTPGKLHRGRPRVRRRYLLRVDVAPSGRSKQFSYHTLPARSRVPVRIACYIDQLLVEVVCLTHLFVILQRDLRSRPCATVLPGYWRTRPGRLSSRLRANRVQVLCGRSASHRA